MLCDRCNIELRLKKVVENIFYFECVKCRKTLQKTQEELEKEYKSVKKEP